VESLSLIPPTAIIRRMQLQEDAAIRGHMSWALSARDKLRKQENDLQELRALSASGPPARIELGGENAIVIDGESIGVKKKGYEVFQLLLDAPVGEYVALSEVGLRTRDITNLPEKLQNAIESQPGVGSRIRREYRGA
jgi:hypothetical protein